MTEDVRRTDALMPLRYRLLRRYIEHALQSQDTYRTALGAARLLDTGHFRFIAQFDVNNSRLVPQSLAYRVELLCEDGWATLLTVHWSRLGIEWADVMQELESVKRQHREGTAPLDA
jgi:hypothetical protein